MGKQFAAPNLVVTRTPLRVSFAGGGTDLPDFYQREYGAVLSTAIDKYVYVTVKRHGGLFNENYRLNYSETEQVENLDEIKNGIARECLRLLEIEPPGRGDKLVVLANCATEPHDPEELIRIDPFTPEIPYDWNLKNG